MRDAKREAATEAKAHAEWRVVIVRSSWHGECTHALTTDAVQRLKAAGMPDHNILMLDAPGSLEIPLLIQTAIVEKGVHGAIAFGVIVEGETHHAEMIARVSSDALMAICLSHSVPVINEILYVDAIDHARARSIGADAKGSLAADTLLHALAAQHKLRS